MYNILMLDNISKKGLERFKGNYNYSNDIDEPDAVIVRSHSMHNMTFTEKTVAIARAGAGVNNIPIDTCTDKGIVVFNTPGANANAVKELVIAGLFLASRKIYDGINFAQSLFGTGRDLTKLIEKNKSYFSGPEVFNKSLGVIGLGAIGQAVSNCAISLGMKVWGYDPYISVDSAWQLSSHINHAKTLDEIYSKCDYITLHLPLTDDTKDMIDADSIEKMVDGVRLLNFARGGLVDSRAIRKAVKKGKIACYVTDFPSDNILGLKNIITIPHLGASTPESEDNCAAMAVKELMDYIENGNINNSVNMPNVVSTRDSDSTRICIIHKNIHGILSTVTDILSRGGINIENMQSKAKNGIAYSIIDVSGSVSDSLVEKLKQINSVVRVRIIDKN